MHANGDESPLEGWHDVRGLALLSQMLIDCRLQCVVCDNFTRTLAYSKLLEMHPSCYEYGS